MSNQIIPARKSYSFPAATILASANAIKTSIATSASPVTYNGGALNGTWAGIASILPIGRKITATSSAFAAAYVNGSTITITGKDIYGKPLVNVLTVSGTGGGATLTTPDAFAQITQIDIQAQASASGAWTFGFSDAVVNARTVRVGTSGDLHVAYGTDGSGTVATDVIPKVQAGEQVPAYVQTIFSDATTTAQDITVYL